MYANRSRIRSQQVDRGKLKKSRYIEASEDTVFCLTQQIAGHNNMIETVIC